MGILSIIGDIFKPAANLVDSLHTSEAEKLQLRNELAKIEAEVAEKQMELQEALATAAAQVAAAEAGSESWLARNYRPFIITSMFFMIMAQSFGFLKVELPEIFWNVFATAFGVMTVAPSAIKTSLELAKTVLNKVKK